MVISGSGSKTIIGTNALGTRYGHHIVFDMNEAVTVILATGIATSGTMRTNLSQALFMLEVRRGEHDTAIYAGEVSVGSFNYPLGRLEFGTRGVVVNLATGVETDSYGLTDTLIDIEDVRATNFADRLTGINTANFFWGLGGADMVNAGTGDETVFYGEDFLTRGTTGVVVNLVTGTGRDGFGMTDTLISIEDAYGKETADSFSGSASENRMFGYDGNDTITGASDNEVFLGGAGQDLISGVTIMTSFGAKQVLIRWMAAQGILINTTQPLMRLSWSIWQRAPQRMILAAQTG